MAHEPQQCKREGEIACTHYVVSCLAVAGWEESDGLGKICQTQSVRIKMANPD